MELYRNEYIFEYDVRLSLSWQMVFIDIENFNSAV